MKLRSLLNGVDYSLLCGSLDCEINDICYDSRKADKGKIFVAIVGLNVDGHSFVSSAYDKGTRVFIVEREISLW